MVPTTGAAAVAPNPAWSMTQTTTYWAAVAVGPHPTNQAVGSLPGSVSAVPVLPATPPGKLARPGTP